MRNRNGKNKINELLDTNDPQEQERRIEQLKAPVIAVTILADYRQGTVTISANPGASYQTVNEILTTALQEIRVKEMAEVASQSAVAEPKS